MAQNNAYPLSLKGGLTEPLSRWLWLFKWLLIIPHAVVLCFLWIAAAVVWIIAFFSILFTGKFPKSLFEYNAGVLRWTWRVVYYSYFCLGTDKYPPFTLKPVNDYPASLEIDYPEKLSRGLVLVKWWLLAIPHYLVGGILFTGGQGDTSINLLALLVIFAAVVLLFTGNYNKNFYKLIMGINRWLFRVVAYAMLMTDKYPPFRLEE